MVTQTSTLANRSPTAVNDEILRACRQFLEYKGTQATEQPSHSLVLNPNENLWNIMYQ